VGEVSAVQQQAPTGQQDREVPGESLEFVDGVPVFPSGRAPARLRTAGQLREVRRKPAAGQAPAGYVYTRYFRDLVPLWDEAESARMRPLSALQQRQREQRRTCTACRTVFEAPVRGGTCGPCAAAETAAARRRCRVCATQFRGLAPAQDGQGGLCLACEERLEHGRRVAWLLEERACRRCTVQLVPAAVWASMDIAARVAFPQHCAGCRSEIDAERAEERRAFDQARWHDLGPVVAWARRITADPEAYAVLDTETTGLGADARIVEIAVTTASGRVLLDTLVDPEGPIPAEASAVHGITDAMVAGTAPRFADVLPALTAALAGRRVVIYNSEFDTARLRFELGLVHQADPARYREAGAWLEAQAWEECAMEQYAVFHGDWSAYWGGYRWQPLNGGHRALGDCRVVVARLEEMSAYPSPFEDGTADRQGEANAPGSLLAAEPG
jgi:hypothetical protein